MSYFGDPQYLQFWQKLRENKVRVTNGWSEAYFKQFTAGSEGVGKYPLVVSYSTSPPADVLYSKDKRTEPATVNISPKGGTFKQVEFVGVVRGSAHPELARRFVDFLLSAKVQESFPLQNFVYPARDKVVLPDLFKRFAQAPQDPATLSPERIDSGRERWITEWTQTVLH